MQFEGAVLQDSHPEGSGMSAKSGSGDEDEEEEDLWSDEEPSSLTQEEEDDLTEAEPSTSPVVYSGQDFDVHGLVRRLNERHVLIPQYGLEDPDVITAGFQRSFVWTKPQMDRFIESILLGFPIPGIFLVRQLTDNRYLVLDGQQRLTTLQRFSAGLHDGREFTLRNVATVFRGLTYKTLPEDLRRQFDDTFIQATLVNSDGSPDSLESIYQIFERLNSGGTQLTPHEIRVALFAGDLIAFIARLNENKAWRQLYGKQSRRLRDHELILRVLSLFMEADNYRRPLKLFLNDFVLRHRGPVSDDVSKAGDLFVNAAAILNDGPGPSALRSRGPQVNAALTEALFVGLMRRLNQKKLTSKAAQKASDQIRLSKPLMEAVSRSTADEDFVKRRLEVATSAFKSA
jgi:hypothetical protein